MTTKTGKKVLLSDILALCCERYLQYHNGFSYDFDKNGERDLLEKLSRLSGSIIFDVGANIGDWALTAEKFFPNAKIHAFELSGATFKTLSNRIHSKNTVLNNLGLSDQIAAVAYKDYGLNSGHNTILLDATFEDIRTTPNLIEGRTTTGDQYCIDNDISHIDLLKIDVEGADHLVLKGFSRMLEKRLVRVIQFEYGYTHGDAKFLMRDFYNLFEGLGYRVAKLSKGPIVFTEWTYRNNDFKSGPNYIAVRNDDLELLSVLAK
jgi:FkbM family methyltransferase